MFKHHIRAVCIVMITVLLLSVISVGTTASGSSNGKSKSPTQAVIYNPLEATGEDYIEVCRNSSYILLVHPQNSTFCIADATNGSHLWYSGMTGETYSRFDEASAVWKAYMQSALVVNYISRNATRSNEMKSYSAESKNTTRVLVNESGIRLEMEFKAISVAMAMEISLVDNKVVVNIPAEDIRENGDFVIKSVDVLPFFGAVANEAEADGYFVYPDGSGAISYFDRAKQKHAYTQPIALDIYDSLDLETTLEEDKNATAMLPIYGVKNNNIGLLAAITEGSESARINVNTAVSNSEIPIHHADFEMVYRNEYKIFLSSITGTATGNETFGVKVDENILPIDREITYFLLRDEQADYSGMANAYREYLISNDLLSESEAADKLGLYLNMFMGTKKENALINPFVSMTTFEYVEKMSRSLLDNGVDLLQVRLRGWSRGGYGATRQSFRAENKLGGRRGLKGLNALAKAEERFNIQLEIELLESAKNRYVSVKESSMPITNEDENKYLLSPLRSEASLNNALRSLKKYGSLDVALASVGSRIYPDYSKSRKVTRSDTVQLWKKMGDNKAVTSAQGGNLYMLSSVEQLYDIPMTASMQQMTDETIPWYSMIVYGSIPYTTVAGNQAGDLGLLCLQWIEYGAMPYFELTENSSTALIDTTYNKLFSSGFEKWEDRVLEIYKNMSSRLGDVVGHAMVHHERVTKDLVAVTYENGYRVIINYGNSDAELYGQLVPARDYIVCAA